MQNEPGRKKPSTSSKTGKTKPATSGASRQKPTSPKSKARTKAPSPPSTARAVPPKAESKTKDAQTKRFRSFDGTGLAHRVYGDLRAWEDRPPLICCSGIACDELYWTLLAPALSDERAVITWDYPYHGDSTPAGDPSEISIESLARHTESLMAHLGIEEAAFVGHSMGVQVMFEVYRQYSDRVSGMITIAGPFRHTVGSLYGSPIGQILLELIGAAVKSQPEITQMAWHFLVRPQLADPIGRLGGLIGPASPKMMERYFHHLQSLDLAVLVEMFRAGQEHTAGEILEDIKVPTLILHGTHDVMTPFELAEEMANRIPKSELVAIEGGAHTLPIEDPPLIHREVSRFLRTKVDEQRRS